MTKTSKTETTESFAANLRQRRTLMTTHELAELLRLSADTLYRMAKRGNMPFVRLGGSVRFDPQMIANWLEERQVITTRK